MSLDPGMRLLIVNADDFGLTSGVCRAVVHGHRNGIVTSTSVLAVAPAFLECARWLDDVPALGVGIHLAAVGEDPPLLSAAEIPTLVDGRGRLPRSWRQLLPRVAMRRIDVADIEREFAAQGELVRSTVGAARITHLDTHQHVHLWPSIGEILVRLGRKWDIGAVRVTRSVGRTPRSRVVGRLAARFDRRAGEAGLLRPGAFAGLDEAGRLETPVLVDLIERLGSTGARTAEIGIHPGEHGDRDLARYEWGYRWGDELDALVAPETHDAVKRAGYTLGSFAALPAVAT